jgi:hypothetical protein
MKKIFALFLFTSLFTKMNAQKPGEWISLFDGKTATGWHAYKKPGSTAGWIVKDSALYLDISQKENRGDLVTDQEFGDYQLKFEWKVAPKSNSGLIFMVNENAPAATWQTGPEFQLIDNVHYPEELGPKQLSGSLYDLIGCPADATRAAGEWNTSEIRLEKKKIIFIVNGKKVIETMIGSKEWDTLIASSKFAAFPNFAKTQRGRIALQDHGGEVWFKNILVRNL